MFDNHPNFAESIIAAVPVNPTQGTDFEVMPGDGVKFAERMPVTLCPPETEPTFDNAEIGYLLTKTGDEVIIERAQEGTIAKPVAPGWRIIGSITQKTLTDIEDASDKHLAHAFNGSDHVEIEHDMGKRPSVTVVNTAGDVEIGAVNYLSLNSVVVSFNYPTSGTIYLN